MPGTCRTSPSKSNPTRPRPVTTIRPRRCEKVNWPPSSVRPPHVACTSPSVTQFVLDDCRWACPWPSGNTTIETRRRARMDQCSIHECPEQLPAMPIQPIGSPQPRRNPKKKKRKKPRKEQLSTPRPPGPPPASPAPPDRDPPADRDLPPG